MFSKYIVSAFTAIVLSTGAAQAACPTYTGFNGNYDAEYIRASSDLNVEITTPAGTVYAFPLDIDVLLVDNQIPQSFEDQIVADASEAVDYYFPTMPAAMQDKLVGFFSGVVDQTVAQMNAKLMSLPDMMNVAAMSDKMNVVTGTFTDQDGGGGSFMLPGTIMVDPASCDATIVFTPTPTVVIDDANFTGTGIWGSGYVDQTQIVKGFKVHVAGTLEAEMEVDRI